MNTDNEVEDLSFDESSFAGENAIDEIDTSSKADCGAQTLAVHWCNISAHLCVTKVPVCDAETQTIHSHISTQTTDGSESSETETVAGQTSDTEMECECLRLDFIDAGTQTVAVGSCNMEAHKSFLPSGKSTQTEMIPLSDAETQTDFRTVKMEMELMTAKNSLKRLNSRLGDELIGSDSSSGMSDSDSTDEIEEENFSDASDNEKQFDRPFSLKYGFVTNVRVIAINAKKKIICL